MNTKFNELTQKIKEEIDGYVQRGGKMIKVRVSPSSDPHFLLLSGENMTSLNVAIEDLILYLQEMGLLDRPCAKLMGRKAGLVGGKVKTEAKARASRENGKKGGRRRKYDEDGLPITQPRKTI